MELKGYLNSRNILNSFDKIILERTVTLSLTQTVGLMRMIYSGHTEMMHPSVTRYLDVTQMKLR